ncbi:MAG: glycine radical domain-containing protein [Planctomycetota bacterium]|jgi:hypothetical protein
MSVKGRLIPVPNLDDRDWQAIRDSMVGQIPSRCPEWTDLNPSDPGVTLIEVFAVALEELLFRLNRVLPKHMREYLNMIGVTLTPASAAKTEVVFTLSEPQSFEVVIKRGFEVSTAGSSGVPPVVFTTDEDLVFAGRRRTLGGYMSGVDAGDAGLLARIAAAPKWGNDDDRADRWAAALNRARDTALRAVAERQGLPPFTVCHVVRSLHHVDGRRIGPTADGRGAGEPVGESVGPVIGTAGGGPTAVLASALKLDARRWFSGIYNLNLTLPGGLASPEILRGLAEGFFRGGGQELQIGVLDAAALRAARADPERHRDVVVRVAGLNARFVELSATEQEELIRRAEECAALA